MKGNNQLLSHAGVFPGNKDFFLPSFVKISYSFLCYMQTFDFWSISTSWELRNSLFFVEDLVSPLFPLSSAWLLLLCWDWQSRREQIRRVSMYQARVEMELDLREEPWREVWSAEFHLHRSPIWFVTRNSRYNSSQNMYRSDYVFCYCLRCFFFLQKGKKHDKLSKILGQKVHAKKAHELYLELSFSQKNWAQFYQT